MNKFILKTFLFFIIITAFNGCGIINTYQELKQDVKASMNFNKDYERNAIQMKNQLSLYKQNFTYDRIASLNFDQFDPSFGKTGLWLPMKFVEDIGGGIYFLNSFDIKKIPIVLVHGAGGNPREWEKLITELENDFQIIVVSYASGMRLAQSSQVIYNGLSFLMKKYNFQYMPIIAHSMGGLVMKNMLSLMTNKELEVVQKFITISTPWGGDNLAKRSSSLDYTLPYWIDMKPNSLFLQEINSIEIPSRIKHYLFFGYNGKITLTAGTSNDGVISLESQLKYQREYNAYKVLGYNETHTSIIRSTRVINDIHNILLMKNKTIN